MSKREHFRLAQEHLGSGEDSRLIYAALELRLCIEEIVYAKLKTYAKRLPESIMRRWQPPQALKALLDIEPGADQNFTLRIAREVEPGVPGTDWQHMGDHRTVSLEWLKKNYNKLGSYLHATMPFVPPKYPYQVELERRRESLMSIAEDLKPAVASSMDAALAMVVTFDCGACECTVACNEEGVEKTRKAVCLNPDCGVEHQVLRDDDGEWLFRVPTVQVKCHLCSTYFWVQEHRLKLGVQVSCSNCDANFRVQWAFGLERQEGDSENDRGKDGS